MTKQSLIDLISILPDDAEVRVLGGDVDTDMNLERAAITHFNDRNENFYLLFGDEIGINYSVIDGETLIAFIDKNLNVIKT